MVTATRPVLFWATAAFVAAVWLAACNQLRMEWTINAQYTYGWSVPFLCAYLFGQRWGTRPPPSRATKSGWPLAICGVALAAFLLIRLVQEANPGWRLVNWAIALQAVMLTFGLLACAGGRAWVKHFAFPILFFLVAVPWPTQLESPIIQNFERADASLTVELMNLLGTPAAQRGNLIEVATGLVGIDEACSGIRSFQATLMLALFFGEFYRSTLRRRLALLAGGVAIVFLANVGRTAFLVWIAASRGVRAIERFHDSAGTSFLWIAFGLVWLLAWRINRKQTPAPVPPAADREPVGSGLAIPRALVLGGLVWMGASELLTRAWFPSHEHRESSGPNWTVRWPEEKNRFARRDFTPRERAELKFSEGQSAQWTDLNGSHWLLFYMKWNHPRSLFDRGFLPNPPGHRPPILPPAAAVFFLGG